MSRLKMDLEHIEERIFDYHEGNLSDTEKAELLNLIHQHPEYENDFALWAQTYAHADNSAPDYELTAGLLKAPATAWYAGAWAKTGYAVLFLTIGVTAWTFYQTDHASVVQTAPVPRSSHTSSGAAGPVQKATTLSGNNAQTLTGASKQVRSLEKPQPEPANTQQTENNQADTENIADVNVVQKNRHTEARTELDTAALQTRQSTSAPVKKTVTKRKSSLTLKPSETFIPTSSDF